MRTVITAKPLARHFPEAPKPAVTFTSEEQMGRAMLMQAKRDGHVGKLPAMHKLSTAEEAGQQYAKAVGRENRAKIEGALTGEMTCQQVADEAGMSHGGAYGHLLKMLEDGVVERRRTKNRVWIWRPVS